MLIVSLIIPLIRSEIQEIFPTSFTDAMIMEIFKQHFPTANVENSTISDMSPLKTLANNILTSSRYVFIDPIKVYKKIKEKEKIRNELAQISSTFAKDQSTAATTMELDKEHSVDPALLVNLISKAVSKETKSLRQEIQTLKNNRGANSVSKQQSTTPKQKRIYQTPDSIRNSISAAEHYHPATSTNSSYISAQSGGASSSKKKLLAQFSQSSASTQGKKKKPNSGSSPVSSLGGSSNDSVKSKSNSSTNSSKKKSGKKTKNQKKKLRK
jgi:hypothetical protein